MVWFSILALTSGFNIFQELSQGAKSMSTVSNLSFLASGRCKVNAGGHNVWGSLGHRRPRVSSSRL